MTADAPGPSPQGSKEGPLAQPLTLITLASEELPIAVDPNAHACLRGFENDVLAELPYLGCNSTLGCELQFVQRHPPGPSRPHTE